MLVGLRVPGHVVSGATPHGIGIIFVLDSDALCERRIMKGGHISGGENIRMAGAQELVHDYSVVHADAGGFRQFDVRLDAETGDDGIDENFLSRLCLEDKLTVAACDYSNRFV